LGEELVDEDGFVLADAVGALGRLILDRRVPPGIVVDDRVGGSQIETGAAGFEANQEERHLAPLKARDRAGAVGRIAAQLDELDPGLAERRFDQVEHDLAGEPHGHPHRRSRLVHKHPHYPDLHHRHQHEHV
jgi:hypothetical protein